MVAWFRRLRARIRYRHFDRDLAREIETHRALKADEHRDRGLAPSDARDAAARDLGNVTLMREDARGVWIAPWLQSVWQDLRYAAASYRRQPGFTIGALLILTLSTTLVTVMFSLAHAVFLRPWRVPNPASVVILRTTAATSQTRDFRGISIAEFRYLREHARSIDVIYTVRSSPTEVADGDRGLGRVTTLYSSDNYLTALQLPIVAGRGFGALESDYGSASSVAVISDRLWRDMFNRDPAVVGRTLRAGRRQIAVVGVAGINAFMDSAQSGFDLLLPLNGAATGADSASYYADPRRGSGTGSAAGRIAPGVSTAAVTTELSALSRQFRGDANLPAVNVITVGTAPVDRGGATGAWQAARLLLLGLLLVLALACANVGNMLLARGLSRRREMAIRLSLGAGRSRLVRQLLTESGVLAIVACMFALGAAAAAPAILTRLVVLDEGFDRPEFFALTAPVFLFALGITVATTLICGLAPALRATPVRTVLLDRHGPSAGGVRLRRLLLSAQVALATVLLAGAGLLTRATSHALDVDPGFALNELELVSFDLPRTTMGSSVARRDFFTGVDAELMRNGIAATIVEVLPLSDSRLSIFVRHVRESAAVALPLQISTASFFDVAGVGILRGRIANPRASTPEIVVSQLAARQLWGNDDPIGKALLEGSNPEKLTPVVVVGVAADAAMNLLSEPTPIVYRPTDYSDGRLLIRNATPAAIERVRALAATLAPGTIVAARPLRDQARDSLQRAVVAAWLAWGIGGLALVLATIGAIGVFAYAVEERRREIGIRLALGARSAQVVGLVLKTAQTTAVGGLLVGLALSIALSPLLRSHLYGLSPFDPRAYAMIATILLAAAAVASWLPARRAVRINPIETLRVD